MTDIIAILIATFGFSLFDWIGYNVSRLNGWVGEKFINPYRIVQMLVQLIIIGILWYFLSFILALCFVLLWFTWTCDWIYYLYCFLFGWTGLSLPGEYKEPFQNTVTWAWWTPYGLIDLLINRKENRQYRVIKYPVLIIQSLIGIILTIFCIL